MLCALVDKTYCPENAPGPRCLATDPGCGPQFVAHDWYSRMPIWHGPHGETGEKCYRPEAKRYPLRGPGVDRCDDDGECVIGGCGFCFSYKQGKVSCSKTLMDQTVVVPPGSKPIKPIPPLWCGCVEHRCTLFEQ
jgi:hypothetical protein